MSKYNPYLFCKQKRHEKLSVVLISNNRKIKALRYTYIEEIDVGNIVEKSVENTSAKQEIS